VIQSAVVGRSNLVCLLLIRKLLMLLIAALDCFGFDCCFSIHTITLNPWTHLASDVSSKFGPFKTILNLSELPAL